MRTHFKAVLAVAAVVAVEFCGAGMIYVDDDALPGGDGQSWETAFTFLQDALTAAVSGDEIRVAQGTYRPDRDAAHPTGTGSRSATFQLKNSVALLGGYAGVGAPEPDARDVGLYLTVLSGDLLGNDGPNFANNVENSSHVVTGSASGSAGVLDGFTVSAGNANGTFPNNSGSGMYNSSSSPTVTNCTFSGNSASSYGGGMFNNSAGSPTVTNCTFSGNSASSYGGGVYGGSLTDCIVSGNSAGDGGGAYGGSCTDCDISENMAMRGGGIYFASNGTVIRCQIVSNVAYGVELGGFGGGLCAPAGTVFATDCLLAKNIATNDGGGAYLCAADLFNCTATANMAVFMGGGVCINGSSSYHSYVRNSVLWANDGWLGSQLALVGSTDLRIAYCDIEGGGDGLYVDDTAVLYWGYGNVNADPLFIDEATDNFRLMGGSPCIDAGDTIDVTSTFDLDGNPRRVDDPDTLDTGLGEPPLVDLGAYEFQPPPPPLTGDVNCDGVADFGDINPFVLYLSNYAAWAATFDGCNPLTGDINGDGTYGQGSFGDINPFVALLCGQ